MPKSKCYGCTKRYRACQDSCEIGQAERAKREQRKKAERKHKELDCFMFDTLRKITKVRGEI